MILSFVMFLFVLLLQATGALDASTVIGMLTPVFVFGATMVVRWIVPRLSGAVIVAIVVPGLALLAVWLTSLVVTGSLAWYVQMALGCLAVFINELVKQLKQPSV